MKASFDTNVIIYAFASGPKQTAARRVIASGGLISVQVLNEFTNVMRKTLRAPWSEVEDALRVIRARFPEIIPMSAETHALAMTLARDGSFAFYDALIVGAAIKAGCDTLYTEDMQNGRNVEGLVILNPFHDIAL